MTTSTGSLAANGWEDLIPRGKPTPSRKERVAALLETLVATGLARPDAAGGETRYFLRR